jgi:hypothetical protein
MLIGEIGELHLDGHIGLELDPKPFLDLLFLVLIHVAGNAADEAEEI